MVEGRIVKKSFHQVILADLPYLSATENTSRTSCDQLALFLLCVYSALSSGKTIPQANTPPDLTSLVARFPVALDHIVRCRPESPRDICRSVAFDNFFLTGLAFFFLLTALRWRRRGHASMTNASGASPSLTGNTRHVNVRGATCIPQENKTENTTTQCARKPETQTLYNSRVRAHQQFKPAHSAWCQPLAHHASRDSHENQLLLPPAKESTSSHVSTFRSACDKAKVGLSRCVRHSSWRTSSHRSIFVA